LADRRAPIEEAISDTKTTIKTALITSMPKIFNLYQPKLSPASRQPAQWLKKTGAQFLPIENGILFPNDCRGYFANRQSDHKKKKT
jgi:hypothetical protein